MNICEPPPAIATWVKATAISAADSTHARFEKKATNLEYCVHTQAYLTAHTSDPAADVARAVVQYCDLAFQEVLSTDQFAHADAAEPEDQRRRETTDLALMHVIRARAGNCEVPNLKR